MKKILLMTTMAALACSSSLTWAATTGEGQVNFTGEILDAACEVVNSQSSPLAVDLGKISKTAFTGIDIIGVCGATEFDRGFGHGFRTVF